MEIISKIIYRKSGQVLGRPIQNHQTPHRKEVEDIDTERFGNDDVAGIMGQAAGKLRAAGRADEALVRRLRQVPRGCTLEAAEDMRGLRQAAGNLRQTGGTSADGREV